MRRALAALAVVLTAQRALADEPIANLAEGDVRPSTKATVTFAGYVEAFYSWNFNQPSNFITNYRGFDDRHNIFAIDNAVIDVKGSLGPVSARVALQVGVTPDTYYQAEPVWKATPGAGPSGPQVWQYIQQANLAYLAPIGRGLTVDAGIFLSPIGPESIAVKDNWNYSRSNLFFGLPYYHTGVRATYPLSDRWTSSLQLYNGWNDALDQNIELSPAAQITYAVPDKITFNAVYFGGVERPQNAPEGRAWRNLFDTYVAFYPRPWLQTLFHFDGGFEPNAFGTSAWAAGAVYLRFRILPWLFVCGRADAFYEQVASNAQGTATPLFWGGSKWVSEATGTIEFRAKDNLSVRLEYRHDSSQAPIYFQGQVPQDASGNWIPNAKEQNTVTVGATAWF